MNIEEFYDQDPRRQTSDEIEFGREWYENGLRFEVARVADTGESVTVEILGVIDGRDAITTVLTGWRDAMAQPESLAWVRARVGGGAEPKT